MSEEETANLALHHVLDLRSADALHDMLVVALDKARTITIDASPVTRISTAAIQILVAFFLAARAHGIAVQMTGITPALLSGFDALGLSHFIEGTQGARP